jgi:hypothetical protein
MPIQKLKVVTTMLIEADTPEQAKGFVSGMSLERIGDLVHRGDAVGQTVVESADAVPTEGLKDELEALGSNLSFFADADDADDESEGSREA